MFSSFSNAAVDVLKGDWDAYSKSSQAIYGKVVINNDFIHWGVPKVKGKVGANEALPCKAEYKYSYDQSKKLHTIKLINKICAYEDMKNSHISKKLSHWNIEIIKERSRRIEAKFYSYTDSDKQSGKGIFYKYLPRK